MFRFRTQHTIFCSFLYSEYNSNNELVIFCHFQFKKRGFFFFITKGTKVLGKKRIH